MDPIWKEDSHLRLPLLHKTTSIEELYVPHYTKLQHHHPVDFEVDLPKEEEKRICCWKQPPEFLYNLWAKHLSSKQKISVIILNIVILLVILSATSFAVFREETVLDKEILGVSMEYPIYIPIEIISYRPILEAVIYVNSVQKYRIEEINNGPTIISIMVEGRNDSAAEWILTQPALEIEAQENFEEVHDFNVEEYPHYAQYRWKITSNTKYPTGFTFFYREIFKAVKYEVIIAASILVMVYVLIIFEIVHRTIAALIGSFICVACLTIIHGRPSFIEVVNWIDFSTIGLLFGMMIMVGIFSETGFFEWSAIKAYKLSGGNLWRLTFILCTLTAIVSSFLDDVTTILLFTPITIRLCKVLDVDPQLLLLSVVMFSNIGGASTPVGDPPNIIIISNPGIKESGEINFVNYALNLAPAVVFASIFVFVFLYLQNRATMQRIPKDDKEREIEIWMHTSDMLKDTESEEERRVKQQLLDYVNRLQDEVHQYAQPQVADIDELEEKYGIRDVPLLINSSIILGCVILMFFLQSLIQDYVDLALPWIALIGAMLHLLVSGKNDIDAVLQKVEFGTLLFFAGLFVLMTGLQELGLISFVGEQISLYISLVPEGPLRLVAAIEILLWVSAFVSGFIDNIPYTTAMVPIILTISEQANLPLQPLVWCLALGGSFGGNATIIGTSAAVVACGLLEAEGTKVTFMTFFKTGFPVMVISMISANVYLLTVCVAVPLIF